MSELRAEIERKVRELGFSAFGICDPKASSQQGQRLKEFVDQGYHGQMAWLEDRLHWRADPSELWPEARSVIMLADNYAPEYDPLQSLDKIESGVVSVYAQNQDYHDVIKKRLKQLGRWLIEIGGGEIKVFVDTAPVMEKPLGAKAGLGWQGKHTNLVSRELGSWFFLGAIFTTLELPADEAETDHCGSCRACLDVCPTHAFPAPYQIDATKCISYLTIEHDGPVDVELREKMGNRIYGCDDCLAVCPWNKFAQEAGAISYLARSELVEPDLASLAELDDASFRQMFRKNPIKRIGRNRFVRNVLYAIGNSKSQNLRSVAARLAKDPDPTVQDAAVWAVERLRDV